MNLAVQGIGVAGAFGSTLDALRAAIRPCPPSGEPRLTDVDALQRFLPARALRRMDHFSQLALLGAHLALEDAALSPDASGSTGIVLATGYGPVATTFQFLDGLIDDGPALVSPLAFAQSVHNIPAATIGIQLKMPGPCCTVSRFRGSVVDGLATARLWLAEGRVERVLFGAVDEYSPVLPHCRAQLAEPSDPHLPQGEGAAFLLLEQDTGKAKRGRIREIHTIGARELKNRTHEQTVFADRPPKDHEIRASCHVPHWGDMPVAQAFELALALILPENPSTLCVSCDREDQVHCIGATPSQEQP
ncbi:beta-ketoacyl synthase chain length factor [Paucidesulfovibrio longus]|uniref:beta-ketoacyl synthase chain length factor n=1 Tax=Paucidesulfovibrio longus TaxID=889 RepID=UPI0003B49B0D|nr:beta-ketoacyl synthase chain length factor [Paucidesulfovibrio longus]